MGRQDARRDLCPDQGSGAQRKPFARSAHRAYRRGSSGRLGLGARLWPAVRSRHAEAGGRARRGLGENRSGVPEVEHDPERATSAPSEHSYSWRTMMKARFGMVLSMAVGAALGGAAVQALHAQAKPPVYMIAINELSDPERYAKEYVSPAQKSVKDHGGEYLAAGPGTQLAGNLPHGPVVILRWDSMEALQAWRNSPDFQAALKIGEKYAKFNIIAVNGLK